MELVRNSYTQKYVERRHTPILGTKVVLKCDRWKPAANQWRKRGRVRESKQTELRRVEESDILLLEGNVYRCDGVLGFLSRQ